MDLSGWPPRSGWQRPKIFISHTREDRKLAQQVARKLEAAGADVYVDVAILRADKSLQAQIQQYIRDSDDVVALVTPSSLDSQWINFEVGAALGLGKRVIPVVDGVSPSSLPPTLRSFQAFKAKDLSLYTADVQRKVDLGNAEELTPWRPKTGL